MPVLLALNLEKVPSFFTTTVTTVVIALIVLGLLVKLVGLLKGRGVLPYVGAGPLLTPAERSFFGVLQQVLVTEHLLFAKVRLADIIKVRPGVSGRDFQSAFNRISSKHADFVVCDPRTLDIVGVIELDDQSHGTLKRQERDSFMDAALAAASIPILRVPAQRGYALAELRGKVQALISKVPTEVSVKG